ncbi:MAG: hypothetical protein J6Q13_02565 [Clostridia bacterium]|nr:hypothetical protein [Clostridia bacterium]
MAVTKQNMLEDLKFVVIKDIIETQIEMMKQTNFKHDGIKTSFSDLSSKVIEDGMQALNLLAFDNGRTVTTKDGREISLCGFIKNLISTEGKYKAVEQMEKLLTSERISADAKADIRTYLNIRYIDEDAMSVISELSEVELNNPILLRQLEGYDRPDWEYLNTLKELSQNSLGHDIYKSFPESIRKSLSKNLTFTFSIYTERLNNQDKKEETNVNNLETKTKLSADDKLIEEIINSYLQFETKSATLDIKDEIYQSLNKSSFGTDYSIDQESRTKFITELKNNVEKSGFAVTKPPKTIQAGWATYQSWNLSGGEKFKSEDISHRFYIAIRPDKMYEVANFLYKKYNEKEIPFYFKLNDATQDGKIQSRKDNLVIYTTNEYLQYNLEIMSTLSKDCRAMEYCEKPSSITGKVANNIGYASEQVNATSSYTERIAFSVNKTLEKIVDEKTLKGLTFDKYKVEFRKQIELLMKNNSKLVCDAIREQFRLDGIDIDNICCDKDVMKNLQEHLQNKSNNL